MTYNHIERSDLQALIARNPIVSCHERCHPGCLKETIVLLQSRVRSNLSQMSVSVESSRGEQWKDRPAVKDPKKWCAMQW